MPFGISLGEKKGQGVRGRRLGGAETEPQRATPTAAGVGLRAGYGPTRWVCAWVQGAWVGYMILDGLLRVAGIGIWLACVYRAACDASVSFALACAVH